MIEALTYQQQVDAAWAEHHQHRPRGRNCGFVSQRLREVLSERQNHRCCHCGFRTNEVGRDHRTRRATVEHIIPVSHGGDSREDNLAMACNRCNSQRGQSLTWSSAVEAAVRLWCSWERREDA